VCDNRRVDERMPASDADIAKIFKAFDTSGDGFISEAELEAALAKGGKKVNAKQVQEILKAVDTNHDSKVSLDEFKKVFELAPDALPAGLQPLVDVTGALLDNLGKVGKVVWDPVAKGVGGAVGWTLQSLGLALSDDQKAEVKDAFDEVSKGSGKLDAKGVDECLTLLGKAPMDLKSLMGSAKEVELEAFYVIYAKCEDLAEPSLSLDMVDSLWKTFDSKGNDRVDIPSFKHMLNSLGSPLDKADLDDAIKKANKDKDGYITKDEFLALLGMD